MFECDLQSLDRSCRNRICLPEFLLVLIAASIVITGYIREIYVAYDWLNGTTEFVSNYTEEEKQQFMNYIEQQLAKIKIPNKDEDFLREKLLLMYSNPLVNYLAACR